MGIGSSSDEIVDKYIKDVLIDLGFVDKSYLAIGDFASAIKDSEISSLLIDVCKEGRNAKCAAQGSTNASVRTMEFVLNFWMKTNPDSPIPRELKKQLQRLTTHQDYFFDCLMV